MGIVTWSTDLAGLDSARIDFGLAGGGFTMSAPVDLTVPGLRTLLLGMKGSENYEFQIVANAGQQTCQSEVFSLTTGPVSNDVPSLVHQVSLPAEVAPGFIITASGLGGGGPGGGGGGGSSMAFILDADGSVVWWAEAPGGTGRVRMSWEGTDIWMMSVNNGGGSGELRRVSMDGLDVETNISGFTEAHHDFTVMPGGIVVAPMWLAGAGGGQGGGQGCSSIVQRTADGTISELIPDVSVFYQPQNECHVNAIHYHSGDDSFTISDRNPSLFVKFSRTGTLQWQFGGSNPVGPYFSGSWNVNHGHHLLPNGNMLFFNNNGGSGSSPVFEYQLDASSFTATQVWSYDSGTTSNTLGDVQRLSNGNTLVTYSNAGVMHEVNAQRQLIQSYTTDSLGYTMHRESLYGPPPR